MQLIVDREGKGCNVWKNCGNGQVLKLAPCRISKLESLIRGGASANEKDILNTQKTEVTSYVQFPRFQRCPPAATSMRSKKKSFPW